MRLALYHNHPSGGAARAFHELGRHVARSHEIDVFTLTTADERLLQSEDYARRVYRFEYSPAEPVPRGFYLNEYREYAGLRRLDAVNAAVASAIDRGSYDAVIVSACRFAQAPPLLKHLRKPSVYYCHEPPRRFLDARIVQSPDPSPRRRLWRFAHGPARAILDRAWRRLDREGALAATRLLTNSRFMAERIETYYGRPASVCYLGIDASRLSTATRDGDYILSVGAIEPHKGYEFVIRAVHELDATERPRLVVIGNDANPGLLRSLRGLGSDLGVSCEFRIGVSEADLVEAYSHARAFVYAPLLEPFGLAALEAMGHGLPVVAVAEGGVRESVVHGTTGLLTSRAVPEFASALGRVLADDHLAAVLGAAGRADVERRWTVEAAAGRLLSEVESVLAVANT